ncbi:MAG: hypothetical protein ACI80V_003318 [Rhodothermales bacterium]|jgi:hypothetical protein
MIYFLLALLLQSPSRQDYATLFSSVLQESLTVEGLVHYDILAAHPAWPEVVAGVELFDFRLAESDGAKLAFWLNAYNVHMLNAVSKKPGRRSVMGLDRGATFFKRPVKVAGQMLTLDQIEHAILREGDAAFAALRPATFDPRIHVALNCAAVSCPRLWPVAFNEASLDAQLDRAMRAFVNSPNHFRVEAGRLVASALLEWFAADFDRAGMPAGDFLLSHMSPDRPQYEELESLLTGRASAAIAKEGAKFNYDWTVNRAQ